MFVHRSLYLPLPGCRGAIEQSLSDYAASLGAQCSLSIRIFSGEPWFSLTTEHTDLPSMEETEASWAEEQSVQASEAKVDELTQSTMQDLWEVLVAPAMSVEVKYVQMVRHTPAPNAVQEVRELLVERAELIRRSPGVVASALYEQFLPPHGLTAFATLSLFSDLAGMGADHVALPATPAFIANARKVAAASAEPFDRQIFRVLLVT